MNQSMQDYYEGYYEGLEASRQADANPAKFHEQIQPDSDYNEGMLKGFNEGWKEQEKERYSELNELRSSYEKEMELQR